MGPWMSTFKSAATSLGDVTDLAVQTDGKILVVGRFTSVWRKHPATALARLNRQTGIPLRASIPAPGPPYVQPVAT